MKSNIKKSLKNYIGKLKHIPNGNCYFANLSFMFMSNDISPYLIFGGLLGFNNKCLDNSMNFILNYIDNYLKFTFDLPINYYKVVRSDEISSKKDFIDILNMLDKSSQSNSFIGISMSTEHIFFRDDIERGIWRGEIFSHFFMLSDFDNNNCSIIDATHYKIDKQAQVLYKSVPTDLLLSHIKMNEHVVFYNLNKIVTYFKESLNCMNDVKDRVVKSILVQASTRLNYKHAEYNSVSVKINEDLIKYQIQNQQIIENWFEPVLNIFKIISVHKFFVKTFFENELTFLSINSINELVEMTIEQEKILERLTFLSYKIFVSSNSKNSTIMWNEIQSQLNKLNVLELKVSQNLLKFPV